MTDTNPYIGPNSDLDGAIENSPAAMYSPYQIAGGTLFGGPIAALYYLKQNYRALGKTRFTKLTYPLGVAFIIILMVIYALVPENIPDMVFPVALCSAAHKLSAQTQLEKKTISESGCYRFASFWNVSLVALLSLITLTSLVFAVFFALVGLGIDLDI